MDQVRPHMREQRFADCASLDWPTGPHPTLSGSGPAPTADRSKTPAAGSTHEGLTPQGPLQKRVYRAERETRNTIGLAPLSTLKPGSPVSSMNTSLSTHSTARL